MRRAGKRSEPAGRYEIRVRLERSYRPWAFGFGAVGLAMFIAAVIGSDPLVFLFSGPAMGAAWWIYRNDPREFIVVDPRRKRLRLVRAYGKGEDVRREFKLPEYVRLETARYDAKPKGQRCMILLVRRDGGLDKVDDRIDNPDLNEVCAAVADAAGLAYVDRGRIDQGSLPQRMGEDESAAVEVTEE